MHVTNRWKRDRHGWAYKGQICIGRGATKSSCGVFQQGFPFSGPQLYLICEMGVGLRSPLLPGLASLKTTLEGRCYYHSPIGGGKKRRKKTELAFQGHRASACKLPT